MSARKGGLLQAAIVALLLGYAAQSQAQIQPQPQSIAGSAATAPGSNAPVLMTADQLNYDQNLGLIRAEGKVELSQGGRTLLADMVSYSERDDKVMASGNVSLVTAPRTFLFDVGDDVPRTGHEPDDIHLELLEQDLLLRDGPTRRALLG